MATFRKRVPYQWQAQIRKKGYPPQSKTFDTRARLNFSLAEKRVRCAKRSAMTETVTSKNGIAIRIPDEHWAHITEEHGELTSLRSNFKKPRYASDSERPRTTS